VHIDWLGVSVACHVDSKAMTVDNPIHSPQLAKYLRQTYFVMFPLFARLSVGHRMQSTNNTAEAGAKILKHDERALPHKGARLLRLDEYIAARIPTREAQCRLFLIQLKENKKRRVRVAKAGVCTLEHWEKKPQLSLSKQQERLLDRLNRVVDWRRSGTSKSSLALFCEELLAPTTDITLDPSSLSKMVNRKYWPASQRVIDAIAAWVDNQFRQMPGQCMCIER
jgi:hypothetical protein